MSHENSVAKSRWTDIQNGGGQQNQPSDDAPMVVNWGSQVGAQTATRHLMYEKDDGPQSSYMRCYYSDINNYILCDKQSGCCDTGCCSRDLEWHVSIHYANGIRLCERGGLATVPAAYQQSPYSFTINN